MLILCEHKKDATIFFKNQIIVLIFFTCILYNLISWEEYLHIKNKLVISQN